MAIEHKDIGEPNIHEPKGVASAPSGRFYKSNGTGSGSWDFAELQGQSGASDLAFPVKQGSDIVWQKTQASDPSYAEIDRAATNQALVANTPIVIGNFVFEDVTNTKFTLTDGNALTVNDAGIYYVSFNAIFKPQTSLGAANEIIIYSLRKDGAVLIPFRDLELTILRDAIANDPFPTANSRIMDLQEGSVLDFTVEAKTANRTYEIQAHLQLFKLANL